MASMWTAVQGGTRDWAVAASACAARTWPLPALTLRIRSLVMKSGSCADYGDGTWQYRIRGEIVVSIGR
jgi:hypothetical protein